MFPSLPRPSRRLSVIALSILFPFFFEVFLHWRKFDVPIPPRDTDPPFHTGCLEPDVQARGGRENAVLVMLARNGEMDAVRHTITSIEHRFNRWFHYPYVFLNDEPVITPFFYYLFPPVLFSFPIFSSLLFRVRKYSNCLSYEVSQNTLCKAKGLCVFCLSRLLRRMSEHLLRRKPLGIAGSNILTRHGRSGTRSL